MKKILKRVTAMCCATIMAMSMLTIGAGSVTVTYKVNGYNLQCGAWIEETNLVGISSSTGDNKTSVTVAGSAKYKNSAGKVYSTHAEGGGSGGCTRFLSKTKGSTWVKKPLNTTHTVPGGSKKITGTTWDALGVL